MHPICLLQRHNRLTTASLSHRPCAANILLKILLIGDSRVKSFSRLSMIVDGRPFKGTPVHASASLESAAQSALSAALSASMRRSSRSLRPARERTHTHTPSKHERSRPQTSLLLPWCFSVPAFVLLRLSRGASQCHGAFSVPAVALLRLSRRAFSVPAFLFSIPAVEQEDPGMRTRRDRHTQPPHAYKQTRVRAGWQLWQGGRTQACGCKSVEMVTRDARTATVNVRTQDAIEVLVFGGDPRRTHRTDPRTEAMKDCSTGHHICDSDPRRTHRTDPRTEAMKDCSTGHVCDGDPRRTHRTDPRTEAMKDCSTGHVCDGDPRRTHPPPARAHPHRTPGLPERWAPACGSRWDPSLFKSLFKSLCKSPF